MHIYKNYFEFFYVLNSKSNCFGTLKFISQILYCIISYIKLDRIFFEDVWYFFVYMKVICKNPSKNGKFQITVKKTPIPGFSWIFVLLNRHCLLYRLFNFKYLQQIFWDHPLLSLTTVLFKGVRWNIFVGDFSIKMQRIHLVKACHILPTFLSFIRF